MVKKYSKKSKRNTRYRKKYSPRKRKVAQGFPMKMVSKLKYVELFNLNPATGLANNYTFRANGIYDPNVTGSGHQPRTFDEHMLIYSKWVVLGSKITYRISTLDNTTYDVALTAQVASVPHTSNDIIQILEQRKTNTKIFHGDGGNSCTLTSYYSAKKWSSGRVTSNQDLEGTSGADPTTTHYFNLQCQNMNSSTDIGTVDVLATIEYIVQFSNPIQFTQS